MVAVELESPELIDEMYEELEGKGVDFYGPPRDFAWNVRLYLLLTWSLR